MTVSDHEGNYATDSVVVHFSFYPLTNDYQVVYLNKGDSVLLNGGIAEGETDSIYWQPKEGLSNPDQASTWCKPDTTTDYYFIKVDPFGCACPHLTYVVRVLPEANDKPEFAPIGAEWYYCDPDRETGNPLSEYEKFVVKRDTTIEGKTCKIIESQHSSEIMYDENGKVFYRFGNDFKLIYDFTANVGDTIKFEFKSHSVNSYIIDTTYQVLCVVTKIESEIIDNEKIRKFFTTLIKYDSLNHVLWPKYYNYLERIGFEYEFIHKISVPTTDGPHTLRCYQDSDIQYSTDWWKLIDKPCDYKFLSITNQISTKELNIFPNPAKNQLSISNPTNIQIKKIELIDFSGRVVQIWRAQELAENTLDIQHIPPGIYLLKATTEIGVKTGKLLVE